MANLLPYSNATLSAELMLRNQIDRNIVKLCSDLQADKITLLEFQHEVQRSFYLYQTLSKEAERALNGIVNKVEEILFTLPRDMQHSRVPEITAEVIALMRTI